MENETGKEVGRRNYLTATATGAALLAASAFAASAEADDERVPDVLYGHGMVWNRALPGVAGELRLSFDLRVNPGTGEGFGSAEDPVHPDWNIHFAISSVKQEKRPKGEVRFTMIGVVTEANNPENVGLSVKILAETSGDATAVAIRLGDLAFAGAGVIAVEYLLLATILGLGILVGLHR